MRRMQLELPKGMEGIGLRNIEAYNKALFVQQAVRIYQRPNMLLSRVYKEAYNSSPVEAGVNHKIHMKASWAFLGMSKSVAEVKKGFSKVIYSGDTLIHKERWLPSGKMEFKNYNMQNTQDLRVKELFKPGERSWNASLVWQLFKKKIQ